MEMSRNNPSLRTSTLFLTGLALSIGWGIRGNFGHEYGAAFAGCLAAIVVALLSGREDWRDRVAYFAFFGAIGWGFGASQSYMQVLSYTESGHALSQWFGYLAVFLIGFLWAAMGGMGTAFAAVAPRQQLTAIFKPLLFLLAAWLLLDFIEDPVAHWLQEGIAFDENLSRHKNPLYWFDADYLPAGFALIGLGIYDLYERKNKRDIFLLPVFAASGAFLGWGFQQVLRVMGVENAFAAAFTYLQGDPSYLDPTTGKPAFEAANFLNNWPQWFGDYPGHVGWFLGLILGLAVYFVVFGKFRNGASLIAWMASGWLISFLLFPVLGSIFFAQYGGLRMTPPRSDDWAGILGVFAAASLWMWRHSLRPVALASLICGIIGGLGFAGMQWLKQLMMSFGSPRILLAKGILPGTDTFRHITQNWERWQAQNWHSFLEQSYGFVNGIALAVVLAFLAGRVKLPPASDSIETTRLKWTKPFAALFILLGLTYFNMVKNVPEWGERLNQEVWKQADGAARWDVPYIGRLPGIDFLNLTPLGWFNLSWALLAAGCIVIVVRHYRSPIALMPRSALGKGQVIFLILLWMMVVANFERALVGWHPSRLLTEWVIFVNAIIATVLVILLPRENETVVILAENNFKPVYRRLAVMAVMILFLSSLLFLFSNRLIYHYPPYERSDHSQFHTRFGPDASWRSKPNLKNQVHK